MKAFPDARCADRPRTRGAGAGAKAACAAFTPSLRLRRWSAWAVLMLAGSMSTGVAHAADSLVSDTASHTILAIFRLILLVIASGFWISVALRRMLAGGGSDD